MGWPFPSQIGLPSSSSLYCKREFSGTRVSSEKGGMKRILMSAMCGLFIGLPRRKQLDNHGEATADDGKIAGTASLRIHHRS